MAVIIKITSDSLRIIIISSDQKLAESQGTAREKL